MSETKSKSKLVLATRMHLGKASVPPTQEEINKTILKFVQTSINCNAICAGIAVEDSSEKIPGYNLLYSIKIAISKAIEEIACTGTDVQSDFMHIIPVRPWGNFVPALNALISWCCNLSISSVNNNEMNELLFISAETDMSCNTINKLQSNLIKEDTLVVGVAFPGQHEYNKGENALTGVTSPWNTAALWNLDKLALTGFPLVSEGLHPCKDGDGAGPSGVEEVSAIAVLQKILTPTLAKAKLIQCDDIEWVTKWDDKEREEWHKKKMASKVARPKRHLELLGLYDGVVLHC